MKTVISVRFRGGCKSYYFDPGALSVQAGQNVIVETAQGLEYAECVQGNHEVDEESIVQPLSPVVRIATDADRRTVLHIGEREKEAAQVCQRKISQHELDMKLVDVSCNFEGNKIIFFFTSEGRVDFRELVKDLAAVFRARIELRQIGVRDEAKMLGGLGICGRPFCCSSFLDGFLPVSIKMAKTQSLSLNPTKISGTCGRLMCCLKYEQDAYEDAIKRMPKNDSFVMTPDGPGNVTSIDLLRETMKVSLDGTQGAPKCYHNCEVCVLRNGKGSRDGIEIPKERPARFVKEEEIPSAEDFLRAKLVEEYGSSAPVDMDENEEKGDGRRRRSRGRGGRGRGENRSENRGENRSENRNESRSENVENRKKGEQSKNERGGKPAEKPRGKAAEKNEKAEKPATPAKSEKNARQERPRRAEKPQRNEKPQPAERPQNAEKPRKAAVPAAENAEGGEKKPRRRPHHRGGRRRSGGGGNGAGADGE